MADVEIKNAIVEGVRLDDADRGLLTGWIFLDYGGQGQGFGGHTLYLPSSFANHGKDNKNYAGIFIWRCMEVAGVTDWSHIPGKAVRARVVDDRVEAIGHITKDIWFDPKKEFAS